MCFSAPASFIAGSVLSAAGIAALSQPKKKREVPLALIPLLFGLQQLTEGLVWVSLQNGYFRLNLIATYLFGFFAQVFWPIFVPLAVFLVEPAAWRRKVIISCGGLGIVVGLYLLSTIIFYPFSSQIVAHSIQYLCPSPQVPFSIHALLYVIATCGSCLFSSHRHLRWLGVLTLIFLGISYYFYTATFASVWCFFAAIISIVIYIFFKSPSGRTI